METGPSGSSALAFETTHKQHAKYYENMITQVCRTACILIPKMYWSFHRQPCSPHVLLCQLSYLHLLRRVGRHPHPQQWNPSDSNSIHLRVQALTDLYTHTLVALLHLGDKAIVENAITIALQLPSAATITCLQIHRVTICTDTLATQSIRYLPIWQMLPARARSQATYISSTCHV